MPVEVFDLEQLQTIRWWMLAAIVVLALLAAVVIRWAHKMLVRLALAAFLLGIGAMIWMQRAELEDCAQTCACRVLGIDVEVPGSLRSTGDLDLPGEIVLECGEDGGAGQ